MHDDVLQEADMRVPAAVLKGRLSKGRLSAGRISDARISEAANSSTPANWSPPAKSAAPAAFHEAGEAASPACQQSESITTQPQAAMRSRWAQRHRSAAGIGKGHGGDSVRAALLRYRAPGD